MAVLIGVSSVVYTNYVVKKLANEEDARIQLIVRASELLTTTQDAEALTFFFTIQQSNKTIPLIVTDSTEEINGDTYWSNLDSAKAVDTAYLKERLMDMKKNGSIPLETEYLRQRLFYDDSSIIIMLKYYPYLQLVIITLFILVAYFAFSSSRRFEQNQVWVGMSKETAHQLGTPLSSLMAWVEYLKASDGKLSPEMVDDIEKDVLRLEVITERFSKVGSNPTLEEHDLVLVIKEAIRYLEKRISKKVSISIHPDSDKEAFGMVTISLFEWVIENLCKNAVDAMVGEGSISFFIQTKGTHVIIDVEDTGKGIPAYLQKTVFNPGFTTRKRGWGLGLSLSKRIVESYHDGQISVLKSEVGKGTTFRIRLNAAKKLQA